MKEIESSKERDPSLIYGPLEAGVTKSYKPGLRSQEDLDQEEAEEMEDGQHKPKRTGPSVNKGKSRQDFETPHEFIRAVEKRFGPISWDLAADDTNYKGPEGRYFDIEDDALKQDWHKFGRLLWLNCPFGDIRPWAKKCYYEKTFGANILSLTPASVGSNWFAEFVHEKARVLFLSPRLVFEGSGAPYPKDLILSVYSWGISASPGYECWRWRPLKLNSVVRK